MISLTNNAAPTTDLVRNSRIAPQFVNGREIVIERLVGGRWDTRKALLRVGDEVVGRIERGPHALNPYVVTMHGTGVESKFDSLSEARRFARTELAKIAKQATSSIAKPVAAEPVVETAAKPVAATRRVHEAAKSIRKMLDEGCDNVFIVGPAGTGKTTLAADLAAERGLQFGMIAFSAGVTETHLLGRVLPQADGSWGYRESEFVRIYEQGGLFLLDEMDAADANVLVSINAALANGFLIDGEGKIRRRHADTIIIAAANTYGTGADAQYVGRSPLDAATRDRFVLAIATVDYDTALETDIASGILAPVFGSHAEEMAAHLVKKVAKVRRIIAENKMRRVVSTRFVIRAAKAIAAGRSNAEIVARLTEGWSASEIAQIEATVTATA